MICGETPEKGYGLLSSTLQNETIGRSIAFKTGLPDITGDIKWKPTLRGFLFQGYFLIIKNFPDFSDIVRDGRVFSHVLLIAEKDLPLIKDISRLQPYFLDQVDKSVLKKPIELNLSSNNKRKQDSNLSSRFTKVIHAFTQLEKFNNTIVWIGEKKFEEAIFNFWQLLSLSEKKQLYFGIHFGTDSIKKNTIRFITTPKNIESRFNNSNFCVVRVNDKVKLNSLLEQLLAKDKNAESRINLFEQTIESDKIPRKDINRIAVVLETFENLSTITDFKKLNTLAHVISEFSPEEFKGRKIKKQLIDKISNMIEKGGVRLLPFLKTFKMKSYEDSEIILSKAIQTWMDKNLFSGALSKKVDYSILFSKLDLTKTTNWWNNLIKEYLSSFLKNLTDKKIEILFNWIHFDINILKKFQTFIHSSHEVETLFTNQLTKKVAKLNFDQFIEFALERNWLEFHAKVLIYNFNASTALKKQLSIDTNKDYSEGILAITSSMNPKLIITFAVDNGDDRLINIAGESCNDKNTLLEDIDFTNENWQKVWLSFVNKGNQFFQGFKNPKKKIFLLFDEIINDVLINKNLLDEIADSDFANILDYPKREQLWKKLSYSVRQSFLKKTSTVFLEALSKNSNIKIPKDKILSEYIDPAPYYSDKELQEL